MSACECFTEGRKASGPRLLTSFPIDHGRSENRTVEESKTATDFSLSRVTLSHPLNHPFHFHSGCQRELFQWCPPPKGHSHCYLSIQDGFSVLPKNLILYFRHAKKGILETVHVNTRSIKLYPFYFCYHNFSSF